MTTHKPVGDEEVAELACTYAALLLHDDNVPITADKITTILNAANIKIQPFWAGLFARVLSKKDLDDLVLSAGGGGAGGGVAAPAAAAATGGAAEAKEESKKEEKKEEPKEESDEDMGFGLFD